VNREVAMRTLDIAGVYFPDDKVFCVLPSLTVFLNDVPVFLCDVERAEYSIAEYIAQKQLISAFY
jgi:hypothetical protein